jgi:hypothetical protein
MAWIESHQTLLNHPKVFALAGDMEWEPDLTLGRLHRLWWWCLDYATDGDLRRFNDAQIACGAGVAAAEGKRFVAALKRSCWVDSEPYFRVHDWWEYAGRFLQVKWKHYPDKWKVVRSAYARVGAGGEETEVIGGCPENGSCNGSRNHKPNLTIPNQKRVQVSGGHPTWEQVKTLAEMRGYKEKDALNFWNHFESVGWLNKHNQPITKWENKLTSWCTNERGAEYEAKVRQEPAHRARARESQFDESHLKPKVLQIKPCK